MALDTYTGLLASVAAWLNRSDLTDQIPDFVTLAEADISRRVRLPTSFVALSGTNATNEVLTDAPDAYLYGSLVAASFFLEHDSRIAAWREAFDIAVSQLNDKRGRTNVDAADYTSYSGLQAGVADYMNRSDLVDRIPGFIVLAETQIKRRLRYWTAIKSDFSIATESVALPTDCKELRSIRLVSAMKSLDTAIKITTMEQLADHRAATVGVAGRPSYAAIVGSNILFSPDPDQTYTAELTYYSTLTPLSDTDTTNSVLTEAPDVYIFGALQEAGPFLGADPRIPLWTQKFDSAISQINIERERREFGASLVPVRLPVVFG